MTDPAVTAGGPDLAGADRDDLEQLERAVRGRLLEVQILKLTAQCRLQHSQLEAYLDVATTSAKPKVCSSSLAKEAAVSIFYAITCCNSARKYLVAVGSAFLQADRPLLASAQPA